MTGILEPGQCPRVASTTEGVASDIGGVDMQNNTTSSRGWRRNRFHREFPTLTKIRSGMIGRCFNPSNTAFRHYGGRGISVCHEWRASSEAFAAWALANGYKDGLEIDRINNDGNYEPSNCRWVTRHEQMRNTRSTRLLEAFGEIKCLEDWMSDPRCLVARESVRRRMLRGFTLEEAMTHTGQLRTNRITAFGTTKSLAEWARHTGINETTIGERLKRGWPPEKSIAEAVCQEAERRGQ